MEAANAPAANDRPYLWDPWLTASAKPERLAVVAADGKCTFAELTSRSDQLAAGLRSLDLGDDPVVSTDLPAGFRVFALALAALRYGFRLFPVGPPGTVTANALLRQSGSNVHIGSRGPPGLRSLSDDELVDLGRQESPSFGEQQAPREGSLIFITSGTTGAPQVVARSRPWYPYKGVAVHARYAAGITSGAYIMGNPTFHLGTLGPALYALQAGSTVAVLPTWSAEGLIEVIDKYSADSAFLSQSQLIDVVGHKRWSSHKPRVVFHSGSPCAPYIKRAAIELMGPVLHEYYGTSQGVISEISSRDWLRHPGSVGKPLRGVRVSIRDGGTERQAGEVGEICVQFRTVDRKFSDENPDADRRRRLPGRGRVPSRAGQDERRRRMASGTPRARGTSPARYRRGMCSCIRLIGRDNLLCRIYLRIFRRSAIRCNTRDSIPVRRAKVEAGSSSVWHPPADS